MKNDSAVDKIVIGCLGVITLFVLLIVISAFIISTVWGWAMPQVFPSAIEQGVLPAQLTLMQAFKLSVLFFCLGLTGTSSVGGTYTKSSNDGFAETLIMAILVAILSLLISALIYGALVFLAWGWVVPDVFSGSVAHNLLPASITFWQALLLGFVLHVLGLAGHRAKSKS